MRGMGRLDPRPAAVEKDPGAERGVGAGETATRLGTEMAEGERLNSPESGGTFLRSQACLPMPKAWRAPKVLYSYGGGELSGLPGAMWR